MAPTSPHDRARQAALRFTSCAGWSRLRLTRRQNIRASVSAQPSLPAGTRGSITARGSTARSPRLSRAPTLSGAASRSSQVPLPGVELLLADLAAGVALPEDVERGIRRAGFLPCLASHRMASARPTIIAPQNTAIMSIMPMPHAAPHAPHISLPRSGTRSCAIATDDAGHKTIATIQPARAITTLPRPLRRPSLGAIPATRTCAPARDSTTAVGGPPPGASTPRGR